MHRAATEGVMPMQMSYSGQNLDIVSGVTAIVVAWMMARRTVINELDMGDGPLFRCWQITTRYIVPVAIITIFVSTARSNLGL